MLRMQCGSSVESGMLAMVQYGSDGKLVDMDLVCYGGLII